MLSLAQFTFSLPFFLFLTIPCSTSFSFSFNFSDPTFNQHAMQLAGDAFFDGNVINLSRDNADGNFDQSQGRATYNQPILLWDPSNGKVANFTTSFAFTIRNTYIEHRGDGFTFFLLPYPSRLTDSSAQGCLGVFENCYSSSETTKNHAVAVEFDSYMNDWDLSSSHVGIDVDSINSLVYQNITLSTINTDIRITSNITYDSSTKLLTVLVYSDTDVGFGTYSLSAKVDLRSLLPPEVAIGFSGATGHGRYVELHQIFNWYFYSTLEPKKLSGLWSFSQKTKLVMIGLVASLLTMAAFGSIIWRKKYKNRSYRDQGQIQGKRLHVELPKRVGPKKFTYDELLAATNNFAEGQKLGRGAFGWVYFGFLHDLNIEVAIKRLCKAYEEGIREFKAEVGSISQLRHRNLVELIGWCHDREELLLVYEYMPKGSLDNHLYPKNTSAATTLPWSLRYQIALGLGSALSYLHRDCNQCVVHRDIKPSNIMLDSEFNAKLGDFGLARLIDHRLGTQTTHPAGTIGYLAPECFYSGQTSKESDVYSFGIVLLEITCGRIPVDAGRRGLESPGKRLVEWVWELYGQGRILEAADDRLNGDFVAAPMERLLVVGLWCAHPDDSQRPNIKKAMDVLNFDSSLPRLPPKMPVPTYEVPFENISLLSHRAKSATARSSIARWAGSIIGAFDVQRSA